MTKTKSTKRALLLSALSLLMCVSMLIGSTFAWFTDSVTSAGNTIQSGTLQVDLVDAQGKSLEGKVLEFVDQDDNDLWEPGCTYKLQEVYVKNAGNLALKYEIAINGITGDAKLLEAIEWTVTVDGVETKLANLKGKLAAGETSKAIVLSGHMKEEAGNEYQGLTVDGISVSVFATQDTVEADSFDNQYDKDAGYDYGKTNIGPYKLNVLSDGIAAYDEKTKTYNIAVNTVSQGGWNATQGNYYAGYTVNVAGYGSNATVSFDTATGEVVWKLANEERDGFIKNGVHQQWTVVGLSSAYRYDVDGDGVTDFTVVNDASAAKVEVANVEQLKKVLVDEGASAILVADITGLDANTAITVASGKDVTLDLNGHTISATANKTGNQELFLVKGDITVKNGSLKLTAENNQGWNAMATIFDVTAGGVLNLDGVTATVGGTDMNFIVHLNNWGTATLNAKNSTLKASYISVRAFNSGNDMNNITIENCTLEGKYCFWVHNFTAEGKDDSTLNVNIYGNGNTFKNTGKAPILYGFNNTIYYDANGNVVE